MTYQLNSNASQTEEWCEAKWVSDSAKLVSNQVANPNYYAMQTQWLKYEPNCGKTVTYEHLAKVKTNANHYGSNTLRCDFFAHHPHHEVLVPNL